MLHRFFLLPLTLCLTATSLLSFPATEGNEEAVKFTVKTTRWGKWDFASLLYKRMEASIK